MVEGTVSLNLGMRLGHYTILERLGAGGTGEVYRARDPRLGRDVAVKILPGRLVRSREAQVRLEHETQVLAHVSHSNILEVFDIGVEGEVAYAVTELLEGETLARRLRRGPLGWRDAAEIGSAVAEGLAAAHARGIVHHDLKPDNIFLTRDGRVKILDFGFAVRRSPAGRSTHPGGTAAGSTSSVAGTLPYMAPEQVRGDRVDHRGDLFSLGAVLCEMLTGRRAFSGESGDEITTAILSREPDCSALRGRVPDELVMLVQRCLNKEPRKRIASAEAVAVVLNSLDSVTRTEQPGESAPGPWVRGAMVAVVVVLLAVVAGLSLVLLSGRPSIASLAVAPVVNDTDDPDLGFVVDSLTEALTGRLTALDRVRVASRSAARSAWALHGDAQAMGLELDVEAVVLAVMRREQASVTVDFEVVDVRDGARIRGGRLVDPLDDILAFEQRLTNLVADAVGGRAQLPEPPPVRRTEVPAAYEAYIKGKFHWNRRSEESMREAIKFFEESIRLDPGFSLPYVGLADVYAVMINYGYLAPRDGWPLARMAVDRALDLDPDLSSALTTRGVIACNYDWDWELAEKAFARALELDPHNTVARRLYSQYLVAVGRFDESLAAIRAAREQDPLSAMLVVAECSNRITSGDPVGGEKACRQALEMVPRLPPGHMFLGMALRQQERLEEALQAMERGLMLLGPNVWTLAEYGHTLGLAGETEHARRVLDDLRGTTERQYVSPFLEAMVLAGLGERDGAFLALDRAVEERCPNLVALRVNPAMDPLRDDPRFESLLRRINLPPAPSAN